LCFVPRDKRVVGVFVRFRAPASLRVWGGCQLQRGTHTRVHVNTHTRLPGTAAAAHLRVWGDIQGSRREGGRGNASPDFTAHTDLSFQMHQPM
jgi:hypothetical protein